MEWIRSFRSILNFRVSLSRMSVPRGCTEREREREVEYQLIRGIRAALLAVPAGHPIINTHRATRSLIRTIVRADSLVTSPTTAATYPRLSGYQEPLGRRAELFARETERVTARRDKFNRSNRRSTTVAQTSKSRRFWNCWIIGFGVEFNGNPLRPPLPPLVYVINARQVRIDTR